MRSLDMDGPYPFTRKDIERVVARTGPGNFALGQMTKDKRFVVRYVGRDDGDIRRALLNCLHQEPQPGLLARAMGADTGNNCFKFSYAQTADAAFEKHCRTYHGFNKKGQLHNEGHPPPPGGAPAKCPVCGEDA